MAVGLIDGLLQTDTGCSFDDKESLSTVVCVLLRFSSIQALNIFCSSPFFDLSPFCNSFWLFKVLRHCLTIIFSGLRK